MSRSVCTVLERAFYEHLHGDWESLERWAWLYLHTAVLLATALAGYAVASGRHWVAALLGAFPVYFLYRRYEHARPDDEAT